MCEDKRFRDFTAKYPPTSLDSFFGNEETIKILQKCKDKKMIPHNILLWGPYGVGKTTLARILAEAIDGKWFAVEYGTFFYNDSSMLKYFFRNSRRPTLGGTKVIILDEAQTMPEKVQGALLKVLEQPTRHLYCFLCTTDPGALLPALVSRCHVFGLTPLERKEMEEFIRVIAVGGEKMPLSKDEVDQIVALANGIPREALKILQRIKAMKED